MSKYLVWEYSIIEQDGEPKETVGAYKYDSEKDALKAYHQKLSGACSNPNYLHEAVILSNTNGQLIKSECIPESILHPDDTEE